MSKISYPSIQKVSLLVAILRIYSRSWLATNPHLEPASMLINAKVEQVISLALYYAL